MSNDPRRPAPQDATQTLRRAADILRYCFLTHDDLADALDALAAAPSSAGAPPDVICETCGGYGEVEHDEQVGEVSYDMALDACEPSMEGQPVIETVRRRCPECEGAGVFTARAPEPSDRDALADEMAKQADLGFKMFCVGVHPETEDSDEEPEWITWREAFAMLRRKPAARETPPDTRVLNDSQIEAGIAAFHRVVAYWPPEALSSPEHIEKLVSSILFTACAVPTGGAPHA